MENPNTTNTTKSQINPKSQIQNTEVKMSEKYYNLKDRTFKFAQRIIDIVEQLPNNTRCEIIGRQLTKAGTSIGANVEEADGTLTKKDFVNKTVIARKEAKETRYWLRLSSGRYIEEKDIIMDIKECQEIISILSAIISKSR
ncbi:MAG: four helix bundle protein [Candidatus Gorgyraea atricola]|nr:four helix bundle protein [Candidatus Gorgyraea atricola]